MQERSLGGRRWLGLAAAFTMIGIAAHAGAGRIGRQSTAPVDAPWRVGDAAPEAPHAPGKAGQPALTLFCCGCGVCRRTVAALDQALQKDAGIQVTGVFQGTAAPAEQFQQETGARFAWVPDPLGQIHARWRVDQCPALFSVAPSGTIAAVEEPHGIGDVAAAVARAWQALMDGQRSAAR